MVIEHGWDIQRSRMIMMDKIMKILIIMMMAMDMDVNLDQWI